MKEIRRHLGQVATSLVLGVWRLRSPTQLTRLVPVSQRQLEVPSTQAADHRLERPAVGWRVKLAIWNKGVARDIGWVKEEYPRGLAKASSWASSAT